MGHLHLKSAYLQALSASFFLKGILKNSFLQQETFFSL